MNKKAISNLMENLVYILLVLVFISVLFFAVTRAGSQAGFYEQTYAKQIALLIDKSKLGMNIELDTFELQRLARKNNFNGNIVSIDNNENKISVKLIDGKGYDYRFFSDVDVVWNLDKEKRKLILNIVRSEK